MVISHKAQAGFVAGLLLWFAEFLCEKVTEENIGYC